MFPYVICMADLMFSYQLDYDLYTMAEIEISLKGCYPNSNGGLQCQCEEQFSWSCDKCDIYGACSNATRQTCRCINELPSDGQFCEPITSKHCYFSAFSIKGILLTKR